MKKFIGILSLFCLCWTASALNGRAAILQVGTHWPGTPYADIQSAVNAAADNDEIWVEQGTYVLSASIVIDKSISLYGGFTGSETTRAERAWSSQGGELQAKWTNRLGSSENSFMSGGSL